MSPSLLNQPAPDFAAEAHNGQQVKLSAYRGKRVVVLYFYPRDGTTVCTKEARSFLDALRALINNFRPPDIALLGYDRLAGLYSQAET